LEYKFENSQVRKIKLRNVDFTKSRITYLLEKAKEKNVIHLGCADSGYTESKVQRSSLLHDKLSSVSKELYGIDVDETSIALLKESGYKKLYNIDVSTGHGQTEVISKFDKVDLIICGEVIEHVPAPIDLISGIMKLCTHYDAIAVITTPNPFSLLNFIKAWSRVESCHPDHNYYISPSNFVTLVNKCTTSDSAINLTYCIELDEFRQRHGIISTLIKSCIIRYFPNLGDGLIFEIGQSRDY